MFSLKNLFAKCPRSIGGKKSGGAARSARLGVESLEDRWVPATIGVPKVAVLDFTGEYLSTTEMREGGWGGTPAQTLSSFASLFNGSRPWLDLNGDRAVNATDASIAVNWITRKVREDYAPYNINIIVGEQNTYRSILTNSRIGDAIAIVTGSVDTLSRDGAWGWAPLDAGNTRDELCFAFTGGSVDSTSWGTDSQRAARWVNQVSRTISHELGHTFGLEHQISDPTGAVDPITHSIMGVSPVARDWDRDFSFHDRSYRTSGGLQNAHQYLSREDVLGKSVNPWMAVLTPGVLTITGSDASNIIGVLQAGTSWTVSGAGAVRTMTRTSVDTSSFNNFDETLNRIVVYARGGNDTVTVDERILATVEVHGGDGNDTIRGGGGNDWLYGDVGNDFLYGRSGNDHLFGGQGSDHVYGNAGEDYLVGAETTPFGPVRDLTRDYLYGDDSFSSTRYRDTIVNFRDDFLRAEDVMEADFLDNIVWYSAW